MNRTTNLKKKQYKQLTAQLQSQPINVDVNTINAQKNISNVGSAVQNTSDKAVGLGLALKNAFNNAGYALTAARALEIVKQAANMATEAVKEYNGYEKNLKIITNKDDVSDLMSNYAEKSLNMKVDISEYEQASEVILRSGKNLKEATEYTDSAIKLAKTGFINSNKAAENLLVISNSYDLSADKLKNVTDALLTLDVETNTEAGALSEAMAKSSKNAQLCGISYEKLGATIAKLRDTTGKSESEIATSLNNIFNRTYRVKPNAYVFENENGETEDLTKPLSDVEKIMNKVGISIRKSSKEFKSFEEIISTIAPIFKDLDSVSQNAIASVFAGQHKNVFLNLVNDWNDIQALTEKAENSMGATESKYTAYLESIEGKTAKFDTSVKEMWNNFVPDNLVSDLTDAGTAVVQFTDKYNILGTAVKSVTFYALAKGIVSAKNGLAGMVTDIKNVSYAMDLATKSGAMTQNKMLSLSTAFKNLNDNQLKLVLSSSRLTESETIQILKLTGLEEAEAKAKLQTLGLTTANNTATAATFSLRGAWEGLKASIATNPIGLIVTALTLATTAITTYNQKQEEARQTAVDMANKYDEQAKAITMLCYKSA